MGTFEHNIRLASEKSHIEGPKSIDSKGDGGTRRMIEELRATGFVGNDEEAIHEIARRIRQGTKRDTRES